MLTVRRHVVVVDPLSTGSEYPAAFRSAGVETVGVLSLSPPAEPFRNSWHPENLRHVHVFDGNAAALAETLRPYEPECVIPGAECGVELADALVELLVPGTGNVPELTAARRDKAAMAAAVRAAGLPHIAQIGSADPAEIDRWLRDHGLVGRPIVLKPPKSGGTDDVHLVPPGADWRPVFDQLYGRVNIDAIVNDLVMVQEYVEGTEYLLDSYSVDGEHSLIDACRYTKRPYGDCIGVYDMVDFLPPDDPAVRTAWPYLSQVLDAVGIRNGCCHSEVILSPQGPRLVEVNARPAGGGHQMITELATGSNQIVRTVEHRVHGRFRVGYQLDRLVASVVVSAPRAGIWRNADVFDGVESLPGFHASQFYFGSGDRVPAPASLDTMLGWVVFAAADHAVIEAGYANVKDRERRMVVDAAEDPVAMPVTVPATRP